LTYGHCRDSCLAGYNCLDRNIQTLAAARDDVVAELIEVSRLLNLFVASFNGLPLLRWRVAWEEHI
jgi:hypothetical protein